MPNEYVVSVTRRAVRLERHWAPDEDERDRPAWGGGGTRAGQPGLSTAGRVVRDWSVRSRNNMRWQFSGLAWEELGPRPAMVTLTYPSEWQKWAPCGRTVHRHREAFKERWRRRWGEPVRGVWVREFQERGAPHLHLYVGLPDAVSDDEYRALVRRTVRRRRLSDEVGGYEARRMVGFLEGEFGRWLLGAWAGCVGSDDRLHAQFGADVAPFFWGATANEATAGSVNWGRVAEYLWRESGKWGQKQVPEDFASPGRSWGKWGVRVLVSEGEVDRGTAMELRRVLWGLWCSRSRSRGSRRPPKPRGMDGLTVFGLDRDTALRLMAWAEASAVGKRLARQATPERSEGGDQVLAAAG